MTSDLEAIEQQNKKLKSLVELSVSLNSTLDLEALLKLITSTATELLDCEAASILLYDENRSRLYFAAATGSDPLKLAEIPVPIDESLAGTIFRTNRAIILNDAKNDSRHYPQVSSHIHLQVNSLLGVPMLIKDRVIGVLEAVNKYGGFFSAQDETILSVTASHAAIAINNATLFTNLQRSSADLRLAYDATIEGWSLALDLRDKETEGHSQRVTRMTIKLAGAYGLSEAEIVHVRRGALLHDIGKMGIPDSILHKPGKLTKEEYAMMRQHPQFAYDMLSPIAYLTPALDIPYCHHEKWDGTGYPRGLKGEQIPLAARLFAVVDVWDALLSDRPYHKSWSKEKTREYIRMQAGKHFDPQVVVLFLLLTNEITQ